MRMLKRLMMAGMLSMSVVALPVMAESLAGLPDFTRIVREEGPAVVNISVSRTEKAADRTVPDALANDPFFEFFRRFAPPQMRERQVGGVGSGFIISPDGYVLTNAHVVANADKITVTLTDKRQFSARLIGADERTDVALLKIEGGNLPVAALGKSSDLQVGQWVLAIGSPFGFDNSVTSGIISALGRQLQDESIVPFIQTDVPVNPGNSGGPLISMDGKVIGINSQILSRSGGFMGISFAIPIDVALQISNQLKATGKVDRGRLGVLLQPLTADLARSFGLSRPEGVLIVQVEPGGPADRAGLKPGDILTAVNGRAVSNGGDLQREVFMNKPGSRFMLKVWRERASLEVPVVSTTWAALDKTPKQGSTTAAKPRNEQRFNQIGLAVSELSAEQRTRFGVPFGLMVRAVSAASAQAGLAPGDVIVGVGSEPLSSAKQLEAALQTGKISVALQIIRDGTQLFVALPVGNKP